MYNLSSGRAHLSIKKPIRTVKSRPPYTHGHTLAHTRKHPHRDARTCTPVSLLRHFHPRKMGTSALHTRGKRPTGKREQRYKQFQRYTRLLGNAEPLISKGNRVASREVNRIASQKEFAKPGCSAKDVKKSQIQGF